MCVCVGVYAVCVEDIEVLWSIYKPRVCLVYLMKALTAS